MLFGDQRPGRQTHWALVVVACGAFASSGVLGEANADGWERVPLEAGRVAYKRPKPGGGQETVWRDVTPTCALEVEEPESCEESEPCEEPEPYGYFLRAGDPKKLLFYFDGGGACFSAETCDPTLPTPTYTPDIDETEGGLDALTDMGLGTGILDLSQPENPYADYTLIYIPYCTGDLHTGNSVINYGPSKLTGWSGDIHHKGADNVLATLASVHNDLNGSEPTDLVVTGVSAGSYGATVAYPYIREMFPHAKAFGIFDGGVGVTTDYFIDTVLGSGGVWNVPDFLPEWVGLDASLFDLPADQFYGALKKRIVRYYWRDRFAEVTDAWDLVQIQFLQIMRDQAAIDSGSIPTQLFQPQPETFCDWSVGARKILWRLSATRNTRYYLSAGTEHTIMSGNGMRLGPGFWNNDFYTEDSARGVRFTDWLDAMREARIGSYLPWFGSGARWDNLSCAPDCFPADDPNVVELGIDPALPLLCLGQAFPN